MDCVLRSHASAFFLSNSTYVNTTSFSITVTMGNMDVKGLATIDLEIGTGTPRKL